MNHRGWKTKVIDVDLRAELEARRRWRQRLDHICAQTTAAMNEGYSLVILSDRAMDFEHVAIPSLLAVGAVHHHLVKTNSRTRIGIVVETGEAREVHHHAMLIGYGADAINPYLAFETLWELRAQGKLDAKDDKTLVKNYIKAVDKGLLKVMSKMGISTLQSYKGAQIFEAIGLNADVIRRSFVGTASKVDGVGLEVLGARKRYGGMRSGFRARHESRGASSAAERRAVQLAEGRGESPVQPGGDFEFAAGDGRRTRNRWGSAGGIRGMPRRSMSRRGRCVRCGGCSR